MLDSRGDEMIKINNELITNIAFSSSSYHELTKDTYLTESITINDNLYFEFTKPNIIFDGKGYTITIDNVSNFAGLFRNGNKKNSSTINTNIIIIKNIKLEIKGNTTQLKNSGWICQENFGTYSSTNNTITYVDTSTPSPSSPIPHQKIITHSTPAPLARTLNNNTEPNLIIPDDIVYTTYDDSVNSQTTYTFPYDSTTENFSLISKNLEITAMMLVGGGGAGATTPSDWYSASGGGGAGAVIYYNRDDNDYKINMTGKIHGNIANDSSGNGNDSTLIIPTYNNNSDDNINQYILLKASGGDIGKYSINNGGRSNSFYMQYISESTSTIGFIGMGNKNGGTGGFDKEGAGGAGAVGNGTSINSNGYGEPGGAGFSYIIGDFSMTVSGGGTGGNDAGRNGSFKNSTSSNYGSGGAGGQTGWSNTSYRFGDSGRGGVLVLTIPNTMIVSETSIPPPTSSSYNLIIPDEIGSDKWIYVDTPISKSLIFPFTIGKSFTLTTNNLEMESIMICGGGGAGSTNIGSWVSDTYLAGAGGGGGGVVRYDKYDDTSLKQKLTGPVDVFVGGDSAGHGKNSLVSLPLVYIPEGSTTPKAKTSVIVARGGESPPDPTRAFEIYNRGGNAGGYFIFHSLYNESFGVEDISQGALGGDYYENFGEREGGGGAGAGGAGTDANGNGVGAGGGSAYLHKMVDNDNEETYANEISLRMTEVQQISVCPGGRGGNDGGQTQSQPSKSSVYGGGGGGGMSGDGPYKAAAEGTGGVFIMTIPRTMTVSGKSTHSDSVYNNSTTVIPTSMSVVEGLNLIGIPATGTIAGDNIKSLYKYNGTDKKYETVTKDSITNKYPVQQSNGYWVDTTSNKSLDMQ